MDTWRNNDGGYGRSGTDQGEDLLDATEAQPGTGGDDLVPPSIGTNERRMQVRAYNFWASQLDDADVPAITALQPAEVPDFGDHAVLLDFTSGSEDPRIAFLGCALALECSIGGKQVERLSDVPARSLLSRITDHYLQIIANQAPIGFEAEFVNQRGATILYRGILLPYSSDGETIDFIYGVINWKELADPGAADELLLEIDQALDPEPERRRRVDFRPLADWADGPGSFLADEVTDAEFVEIVPLLPGNAGLAPADPATDPAAPYRSAVPQAYEPNRVAADPAGFATMQLADWLALAREQALDARDCEDRTRNALYEAIGRAWDFALAAAAAPEDFAAMLAEAGLTAQQRAPMTPIVKLVFGADYDKTRLTEYAAALAHARRIGLARGSLADHLRRTEGGLKGLVAAERLLRRQEAGKPPRNTGREPLQTLARKLRAIPPLPMASLPGEGEEFALVMVRRSDNGTVALLGEIPGDAALLEKAARHLLG